MYATVIAARGWSFHISRHSRWAAGQHRGQLRRKPCRERGRSQQQQQQGLTIGLVTHRWSVQAPQLSVGAAAAPLPPVVAREAAGDQLIVLDRRHVGTAGGQQGSIGASYGGNGAGSVGREGGPRQARLCVLLFIVHCLFAYYHS